MIAKQFKKMIVSLIIYHAVPCTQAGVVGVVVEYCVYILHLESRIYQNKFSQTTTYSIDLKLLVEILSVTCLEPENHEIQK